MSKNHEIARIGNFTSQELVIMKAELLEAEWLGRTPGHQGFEDIGLPEMHRKDKTKDKYIVYSSKDEFKIVHAATAVEAIIESKIEKPFKVVHENCRIGHVLKDGILELVENDKNCNNAEGEVTIEERPEVQNNEPTTSQ